MNTHLQKILLLGIALTIGLPAQAMKPGDAMDGAQQALTASIILGITNLFRTSLQCVPINWATNYLLNTNEEHEPQATLSPAEQIALNHQLIAAVINEDMVAIIKLIEAEADVNARDNDGETPLHWAAVNGHTEILNILIQAKANPNARNNGGNTPLHLAAIDGHTETVKALLENEANPNARNNYYETPLHWAAIDGHTETVKVLMQYKADINACNRYNETPLHWAANDGHTETVKVLIQAKANIHTKNKYHHTPLDWAAKDGHTETVIALTQAIENINAIHVTLWNDLINNQNIPANQRLEVIIRLLGQGVVNINWISIFTVNEIIGFLTAPHGEAIAPMTQFVENECSKNIHRELRQKLARGLEAFLTAISERTDIELTAEQQGLIEYLINQLYSGPTTKSARNFSEVNEGEM